MTATVTTINVKGPAYLSDPCYFNNVTDPDQLESAFYLPLGDCSGTWHVTAISKDTGEFGIRTHSLFGILDDDWYPNDGLTKETTTLPVDAGLMAFIPSESTIFSDRWDTFCEDLPKDNIALHAQSGLLVTSSGYGDGCYPVTLSLDKTGRTVHWAIDFCLED